MTAEIIDALLQAMITSREGVSDLVFTAGKPPLVESHGALADFPIDTPDSLLDSSHIEQIATHIINGNERLQADFAASGACDCSYALSDLARFRVNIFKQKGRRAIVMRKLQAQIPTLAKLGLPPIFQQMIREKNGIIFVTGSTGSGKTTTLAAMLNEINETQPVHIVTLEDPIEFSHPHKQAAFNQRELGNDFTSFASGLRSALRQAPKVILVGEIRDRETMEIALTASETGHIVYSTLHTINAGQTINRILGMFNADEEQQVRQRLADTIRYIVSQRLIAKTDGSRMLITEIMGSSLRTRETLLYGEGENRTFQEIIEAGETQGWHSFDQSLINAYKADLISDETALLFCTHKHKMGRDIDLLKTVRHQTFGSSSGLRMEVPKAVSSNAA
ncbi:MAG: PilT/PilU family type 4a pilus ATPase [Verrucomicrobiota bacterium]|nr:PilT/PilU family type 4a pilus ATPase [Verrucomicrobiota bacterium]